MDLEGEEGLPMHDVYRKKSVTVTILNKQTEKKKISSTLRNINNAKGNSQTRNLENFS